MESGLGPIHWLYGLLDYLEYTKDEDAKRLIEFIIKLSYANDPIFKLNETGSLKEFTFWLHKFAGDTPILGLIQKYIRLGFDTDTLPDLFSRGQVKSKIWLSTELAKIQSNYNNIFIYAGWFGQLTTYFDVADIHFDKMRIFDLDPVACEVSDKIFNAERLANWQVKSVCADLDSISWTKNGAIYNVSQAKEEMSLPDLIINSSAEHMTDDWFFKIKFKKLEPNPIIAIQSNNLFEIPEHVNCVHSLDHMKKKFPLEEILFEGELQLKGYKRFMLIGRP